jgi:hypothetical protein
MAPKGTRPFQGCQAASASASKISLATLPAPESSFYNGDAKLIAHSLETFLPTSKALEDISLHALARVILETRSGTASIPSSTAGSKNIFRVSSMKTEPEHDALRGEITVDLPVHIETVPNSGNHQDRDLDGFEVVDPAVSTRPASGEKRLHPHPVERIPRRQGQGIACTLTAGHPGCELPDKIWILGRLIIDRD